MEKREQLGGYRVLFPHTCEDPGEEHHLGVQNQRKNCLRDLALLEHISNVDGSERSCLMET